MIWQKAQKMRAHVMRTILSECRNHGCAELDNVKRHYARSERLFRQTLDILIEAGSIYRLNYGGVWLCPTKEARLRLVNALMEQDDTAEAVRIRRSWRTLQRDRVRAPEKRARAKARAQVDRTFLPREGEQFPPPERAALWLDRLKREGRFTDAKVPAWEPMWKGTPT